MGELASYSLLHYTMDPHLYLIREIEYISWYVNLIKMEYA